MNKFIVRIFSFFLAALLTVSAFPAVAAAEEEGREVTVLFTHDLHSSFYPVQNEFCGRSGGYSRLAAAIKSQKEIAPDAILVDGGDFSMGSLFQTGFATDAYDLRILGEMGYDVTTFGNHEFDYLQEGLADMLNVAKDSGDALPYIVSANYKIPDGDGEKLRGAFDNYGVRDYVIIRRGDVYFAVFGILGYDADNCAPNSEMTLLDPVETAQKTADRAREECLREYGKEPFVICLSHSGTRKRKGEDYELARKTEGIHLIVSAHTHSTLTEPAFVSGTYIVSANDYGKYLGVVKFCYGENGEAELSYYDLVPIHETVKEDEYIKSRIEEYRAEVEENYLSAYGLAFDTVLTYNPYRFETIRQMKSSRHESAVCNVYTDAYKWAAGELGDTSVDVAINTAAVIRATLPKGDITVSDVFNAVPLGVGEEGKLVSVYLTGEDLRTVLEIDTTMQPFAKSYQMYFSGLDYSYNKWRAFFNRVDSAVIVREDGTREDIEDEKLYRVVTGTYAAQLLGLVEDVSMGVLSVTPRDKEGNAIPVEELYRYEVTGEDGESISEWYAIAAYLLSMNGKMDEKYSDVDGRKVVYRSISPVSLFSSPNEFTYITAGAVVLLTAIVAFVAVLVVKAIKKKKTKKA